MKKLGVITAIAKRLGVLVALNLALLLIGVSIVAGLQAITARPVVIERAALTPPTPTATLMLAPANIDPQALLVKSDATMNQLHSLTEMQRFFNDSGVVVVTTTYQFLWTLAILRIAIIWRRHSKAIYALN